MDKKLCVLLGVVLTASLVSVTRLLGPSRVFAPGEEALRPALPAAAAALPHLRRGVTLESAGKAIGHLHALTQAAGVMIDDGERVLATHGVHGEELAWLPDTDRVAVERGPAPFGNTVVAPLIVGSERIGRLAAFYGLERRL